MVVIIPSYNFTDMVRCDKFHEGSLSPRIIVIVMFLLMLPYTDYSPKKSVQQ